MAVCNMWTWVDESDHDRMESGEEEGELVHGRAQSGEEEGELD